MADNNLDSLVAPLADSGPASNADLLEPLDPTAQPEPEKAPDLHMDIAASVRRFGEQQDQEAELENKLTAYQAAHSGDTPEQALDVARYSIATGLPPAMVREHLDELKTQVDTRALAAAIATRPQFGKFLAIPNMAPLVKDDVASLGWLEWGLTGKWEQVQHTDVGTMQPWEGGKAPESTYSTWEMKTGPVWARAFRDALGEQKVIALSTKQAMGKTTPEEDAELDQLEEKYGEKDYGAENFLSKQLVTIPKMAPYLLGSAAAQRLGGTLGRGAGVLLAGGAAAESGPGELVAAPAGAAAGQEAGEMAASVAFDAYQNFGPQYRQLRKLKDSEGHTLLSDEEARTYSAAASVGAALVTGPLHAKLLKAIAPGAGKAIEKEASQAILRAFEDPTLTNSLKRFSLKYGQHWLMGGVMMATQAGANAGSVELAKTLHDQDGDLGNVGSAVASGFKRGVEDMWLIAGVAGGREYLGEKAHAEKTRQDLSRYELLVKASAESKLLERDPETFQRFLEQAARSSTGPDGVTHAHVPVEDWNTYWQAKKADPAATAAELLGDDGKAYAEAVATQGELTIPVESFFGRLGKTEHAKGLALDVKFNSEARTPREQRAFEKEQGEKLARLAKERATELHADGQEVHDFIRDQALGADVPAREADAVAAQVAAYARTMALRLNVSVREAATLGGLTKLRILGPKGDTIANAALKRFRGQVVPSGSAHLKTRLASMEAEARAEELYRDTVTGAFNNEALADLPPSPDRPLVAHVSVETKWINDQEKHGHPAGDRLYRAVARGLSSEVPSAVKLLSGDFTLRVKDQAELNGILERVRAKLPGHASRFALTGRVGPDLRSAAEAHYAHLDELIAKGERAHPRRPDPSDPRREAALPAEMPLGLRDLNHDEIAAFDFGDDTKANAPMPEELVARVRGMSDEAYFNRAYVKDGILTGRGWDAIPRKANVAALDGKGVKRIVKLFGDPEADLFMEIFSKYAAHYGGSSFDFARLHGDEFAAQHDDPAQLERFLENFRTHLHTLKLPARMPDGEIVNFTQDFRAKIGDSYGHADELLNAATKAERDAAREAAADADRRGVRSGDGPPVPGPEGGVARDRVPPSGHRRGSVDLEAWRSAAFDPLGRGAQPQAWPGSGDRSRGPEGGGRPPGGGTPVAHLEGAPVVFKPGPGEGGGSGAPPGDPGAGPAARGDGREGAGPDGGGVREAAAGRDAAGRSADRVEEPAPSEHAAELGPDAHEGKRTELRPDPEKVAEVRAFIDRMRTPDKKAMASAFLDYAIGAREDRPEITPKLEKELAAKFIVDPYGYRFDVNGRDMTDPLGGPRGPGISRDASQHERMRASDRSREMRELAKGGQSVGSRHKGKKKNLFDSIGEDGPRGTIEVKLSPDGRPVKFDIQMLERDRSTLAHETAHFLSWSLHEIATSDLATEAVKADYGKLLEWAGYSSPEERVALTQERAILKGSEGELSPEGEARLKALSAKEERISHGWEQYLAEGKSPSRELASTFGRFRAWMLRIYRGLPGIEQQYRDNYGEELKLSDEVRRVFDRLLAADDAVKNAEQESGAASGPIHEVIASMSPAEQREYMKALREGKLGADEETNKRAAEIFKEEVPEQRAAVEADVTKELDREPAHRAQRFLQKGELVDGDGNLIPVPKELLHHETGEPLKLNKEAFIKQYGEEAAARMPPRLFSLKKKEGVTPDTIAAFLGFETGRQMVEALGKAEPREQAIARETQARMDELYAPALKLIGEAAMAAVHSDAAARAALLELRAMAKQVNPAAADKVRVTDLETLKRTAEGTIEASRVGDLDPENYLRLERQAALKRERLWGEGKKQEAMEAAEARLLNQLLYRAARDAADKLDREKARLSKTSVETRSHLGKADISYRDVHDQILEAIGLAKKATDGERVGLDLLLERARQDGQLVDFDVSAIRRLLAEPRPWDSLQVAEARAIADAITNIRHIAKLKEQLDLAGKAQAKDEWFRELIEHLMRRPALEKVKYSETAEGAKEAVLHVGRGADAVLTDTETIAAMLDAHDRQGPAHRLFVDARLEARDRAVQLDKRVLVPIRKAWDNVPKEIQKLRDEPVDVAALLPVPPGSEERIAPVYTRDSLWMLYLNWGNAGNRQRVRDGNGWQDANVEKALGLLSDHELDFLQSVLDTINGLYPDVARVHRGRTGLELEKVPATPITINGKTRAGGYFPLKYDARLAKQGEVQEGNVVASILAPTYVRPATLRSHTKERAEEVHAPVSMSWGTVPAHLAQVIHDVTYGDWVRQAGGVLLDEKFKALATQYIGEERQKELVPWLRDVANARADSGSAIGSAFTRELGQFARNRMAAAAIAYNLPVIAQGIVDAWGAFQEDVPLLQIASAYRKVGNPQNWGKFKEFALSKELAYRDASFKDNIRKTLMGMGPEKVSLNHAITETGFALYEMMDKFSTRVTFKAAFDDAKGRGLSDADAAKRGDDVVRRMFASHDVAEKAPILRSKNGIAGVVMFYGFSNRYYNALRRSSDRVYVTLRSEAAPKDKVKAVAQLAGKLMALGVIGSMGSYIAGRGPEQDENPAVWAVWRTLLEPLNTVPFLGGFAEKLVRGQKVNARSTPELALIFDTTERIGKAIDKFQKNGAGDPDVILAEVLAVTAALGGPVGLVNRTGGYAKQLVAGEAKPRGVLDVPGGIIYGQQEDPKKRVHNPFTDAQSGINLVTGGGK